MWVFENRVLERVFGFLGEKVTGGQRKLHNEELHYLYYSPNICQMMTSTSMRWGGHVARMERRF
jgi:hypothetical protein